jgi:hypothetical protein
MGGLQSSASENTSCSEPGGNDEDSTKNATGDDGRSRAPGRSVVAQDWRMGIVKGQSTFENLRK